MSDTTEYPSEYHRCEVWGDVRDCAGAADECPHCHGTIVARPALSESEAPARCERCRGKGFVAGNPYPCDACNGIGFAPLAASPPETDATRDIQFPEADVLTLLDEARSQVQSISSGNVSIAVRLSAAGRRLAEVRARLASSSQGEPSQ